MGVLVSHRKDTFSSSALSGWALPYRLDRVGLWGTLSAPAAQGQLEQLALADVSDSHRRAGEICRLGRSSS